MIRPNAPQGQASYHRTLFACLGFLTIIAVIAVASLLNANPVQSSRTPSPDPQGSSGGSVRGGSVSILGPAATSLDPAVAWDAGSSQMISAVFETLTAVDTTGHIQPALAQSWQVASGGKQMTFHLRPGLKFSDGSALKAADVVTSWMRVLNPAHPSQLSSLLDDVVGAEAYARGSGSKSAVGLTAPTDTEVDVSLANPASDFAAVASSPVLAVVPPGLDSDPGMLVPGPSFVGSGAYTVSGLSDTETTLKANPLYWAASPAMTTIHVITTTGGKSAVDMFRSGDLDYTPVSAIDASWLMYDKTLGPDLRLEPSPSVEYYGFDTSRPPFDNVHVRRAFALGIDWKRLVTLERLPTTIPATGMVPAGVPGHSDTDFAPGFDLTAARAELAAAGYPNGVGFPRTSLITSGSDLDGAILGQLKQNLGITLDYVALDGETYNNRIVSNPPAMWSMDWIADYPGANDFLGLLLSSGKPNNFGRWKNTTFDQAVASALSAGDPASVQAGFDRAQSVVKDQAPVIPVSYGAGYSLAARGLLGAEPNAEGLIRYAGLAWTGK